ncbi:hypothetical protein TPE_1724 [Treponema pedis str. T A4]|uniref:Uncharacterized protein n=1 Tax=Treponema pedis str. T A4 TaxID=1291379 RepID=S6A0I6_9SPIR|nr:hypothetical protein TPE_1724 [Treponema pedis str. T A4]
MCLNKCGFWSGSVNACVKIPAEKKTEQEKDCKRYRCSEVAK